MATFTVTIDAPGQPSPISQTGKGKRRKLREAAVIMRGLAGGEVRHRVSTVTFGMATASGTLTLVTAAGAVGAVINGVTVTATASGGDTNTAQLIANAINNSVNPLVAGIVKATASGNVVTVRSVAAGATGNSITFTASGTGVTASAGGRLSGGTSQTFNL